MERIRNMKRSGVVTALLFLVAVGLLLAGSIGAVRAAVFSKAKDDYDVEIDLYDINVRILENGKEANGELLKDLLGDDKTLAPDKTYKETITLQNPGTIDEYVKVTVRKYWEKDGKPMDGGSKIVLTFDPDGKWIRDKSSTEDEQTFYYKQIVKAGDETSPIVSAIKVEGMEPIVTETKIDEYHTQITVTYEYDGANIVIEVDADGIQTHNAEDAILYKWGVSMSVGSDGSLSLN